MVTLDAEAPRGILIDFDHAAFVDPITGDSTRKEPITGNRTGTTPFMALDLCDPPSLPPLVDGGKPRPFPNYPTFHLPRYDLESFIWVLLWFLIRPRGPGMKSKPPPPSQLNLSPDVPVPPNTNNPSPVVSLNTLPVDQIDDQSVQPHVIPSHTSTLGDISQIPPSSDVETVAATPKSERDYTWWNTDNLALAAELKKSFAAHPKPQALSQQSHSLQPLMWELLSLLDASYTAQQARREEILEAPKDRDVAADLEWFATTGGTFTADIVIAIVERYT